MASISQVLKVLHKDTPYLPVRYPELPKLDLNTEKPSAEDIRKYREAFAVYEKECAATKDEIDARFAVALERIKLCALLHGAMNMFGNIPISEMKHFKWCPHDEWMSFTKPSRSLFPLESQFL